MSSHTRAGVTQSRDRQQSGERVYFTGQSYMISEKKKKLNPLLMKVIVISVGVQTN
tara:strand:- start:540 stop:707 length:168 start_codon:yes stop_codon:yes gene_type:complete